MAYSIRYKQSVAKDLARLSKPTQRRVLDKIEAELIANPLAHPALKGAYAGLRRLRVGDYPIIYTVSGRGCADPAHRPPPRGLPLVPVQG